MSNTKTNSEILLDSEIASASAGYDPEAYEKLKTEMQRLENARIEHMFGTLKKSIDAAKDAKT